MDRRYKYQLAQKQRGLCIKCGKPPMFESMQCFRHHVLVLLGKKGLPTKVREGSGRNFKAWREELLAFLFGRYLVTKLTGVPPDRDGVTWDKLRYSNLGTDDQFQKLITALDKKARKEYAHNTEVNNATDTAGKTNDDCDSSFSN